ncbi:MAG: orotate phosphoribosyltransferase, partial [Eubacteriales bacterium]|nr:orotate phosphoribosyltransferase [Eubacteriales bacterium]
MLSQEEILNMFLESGALLEGHFLLTSGRHSNRYMQCARVLQYPHYAEKLGAALAEGFKDAGVEAVIGPAMGGIIVAHEVGRALGTRAFFAEREQGVMTLRRGFTLEPGTRVLVCEDVVTTGGSVREVMEVVREKGAQVVGVGVLVDRSGGKVDFGVPLRALLTMEIPSYDAAECPLCREGLPLVKPGSRQI